MIGPPNNPDYSSPSGTKTFFRRFKNTTQSSKSGFALHIKGTGTSIVDNTTSLGSGNIRVFIKIPTTTAQYNNHSTGFLDLALPFNGQSSDNSGCHSGTFTSAISNNEQTVNGELITGTKNEVSFGTIFVPKQNYIIIKIEADSSWAGDLDKIRIDWN